MPLQSSSIALHVSGAGSIAPTHGPRAPPMHACDPFAHAPSSLPHSIASEPTRQAQPSSTVPSQSSSDVPSQTSATATTPPSQPPHCPFLQVDVPCWHAPTSLPQGRTSPSSVSPSQSSSMALHVSATGLRAPTQSPNAPSLHT
jgi:hypothetical protein